MQLALKIAAILIAPIHKQTLCFSTAFIQFYIILPKRNVTKKMRDVVSSLSNIQSLPASLFLPSMNENNNFSGLNSQDILSHILTLHKPGGRNVKKETSILFYMPQLLQCASSSCLLDQTGCRGAEVSPGVFHLYEVRHVHWVWRCIYAC